VFAVSLTASISDEIDRLFRADVVVYDETSFFGFPTTVAEQVRGVEEVAVVNPVRTGPVRVDGSQQFLSATDPALGGATFDPQFAEGSWQSLTPGGVLLLESWADGRDLGVRDTLRVEVPVGGVQSLEVQGTFTAESGGGPMLITLADYERWFPTQADFLLLVNGRPDADPVALQQGIVGALDAYPQLSVRNQQEYKEYIEEQVNAFLGLVYALLALAIVIAVFGIVNTLALSVFERTREIGLLRAVGLSVRQARRMVRYESVIVALLGGLLGAVVGVIFGAVAVNAIDEVGVLRVPFGSVVVFVVLAGLAGVLAAVWPARRASRIDVLKAITHD
jgi:putative ABC transport system permease protein